MWEEGGAASICCSGAELRLPFVSLAPKEQMVKPRRDLSPRRKPHEGLYRCNSGGGRLNAAKYQVLRGFRLRKAKPPTSSTKATTSAANPDTGSAECIAIHSGQASCATPSESAVCALTCAAELGSHWPWMCAACATPTTPTSITQSSAATRSHKGRRPLLGSRWVDRFTLWEFDAIYGRGDSKTPNHGRKSFRLDSESTNCHRLIAFVNAGTISNRSPTAAISATSKIGASASLLIAITVRAPFIPTRC